MNKLFLLVLISVIALGCEKVEPEREPPKLTSDELRVKECLEWGLEEFANDLTEFIVYQRGISSYTTKLHIIENEELTFDIIIDDWGVAANVHMFTEERHDMKRYFYSYANIRGVQWSWDDSPEPSNVELTIDLTQEYNWKD